MNTKKYDVCIVGAGTAGMAAAYALKESGYEIALVEKNSRLGGTAVNAWVETWIEGINPPYLVELFCSLKKEEKAWGELEKSWLPKQFSKYDKTSPLRFDSSALAEKYATDIKKDGNITVLTGYALTKVGKNNNSRNVSDIEITNVGNADDVFQINARYFIDSSGDGILCRQAGCRAYLGEDAYEEFEEDIMRGKKPQRIINEPSLFFKVEKKQQAAIPFDEAEKTENPQFFYDGYRDWFHSWINPMTGFGISGIETVNNGIDKTYKKARLLIRDFWNFILREYLRRKKAGEKTYGYTDEDMDCVPTGECAPMLGIRESYRIECEYMLRQSDLARKIQLADLKDFIACSSYEIDLHMKGSLDSGKINAFNAQSLQVSGIPYKCLIPRALDNVLIACRAFGASHIALAARRINKDMAQLGWAAGHAMRLCCGKNLDNTRDVCVATLQGSGYTGLSDSVRKLEERMK
jgi:flavin-dependent dehydrogenase